MSLDNAEKDGLWVVWCFARCDETAVLEYQLCFLVCYMYSLLLLIITSLIPSNQQNMHAISSLCVSVPVSVPVCVSPLQGLGQGPGRPPAAGSRSRSRKGGASCGCGRESGRVDTVLVPSVPLRAGD